MSIIMGRWANTVPGSPSDLNTGNGTEGAMVCTILGSLLRPLFYFLCSNLKANLVGEVYADEDDSHHGRKRMSHIRITGMNCTPSGSRSGKKNKRAVVVQLMSACISLCISCTSTKKWPNLFFFPLLVVHASSSQLTFSDSDSDSHCGEFASAEQSFSSAVSEAVTEADDLVTASTSLENVEVSQ